MQNTNTNINYQYQYKYQYQLTNQWNAPTNIVLTLPLVLANLSVSRCTIVSLGLGLEIGASLVLG